MMRPLPLLAIASAIAVPQAASAQTADDAIVQPESGPLAQFTPRPSGEPASMDYSFFDTALEFMVLRMGQSTREGLPRPEPMVGTRQVYGHDSRYRLEGNRILYSFLDKEAIEPLTDYLHELERIGTEIDIAALPRDEQLAYWLNLHNVAVIEAIARNYPMKSPSRMLLEGEIVSLDTLKLVTVAGVELSPHDIRNRIVFPNWQEPEVLYGFTRGEVGGPSIQRRAFTSANLDELLAISAREFVNSLRGVESYGKELQVSKIYAEAARFYFPAMDDDLRAHLTKHADDDVKALIAKKPELVVNQYEDRVADLAGGEREPVYSQIESNGQPVGAGVTPSIARLLNERMQKMDKLRRRGELRGRVIVLTPPSAEEQPAAEGSTEESEEGEGN
ncbi:DUF547 domain-containing protein [Qipengyuania sp. 1NDH17]|uniref:DUF547 domain-containing protein n=1 Tax=Qipengyuania polymorpha TaxID=2867234 RepID=A0ABS7J0A9_9SPHN|nr:DUF547 domain-containing protein [Qipengyuania polymorpha]MBX7459148.1 DUF547 domain-containing protein [Qipengyuania polymorpha]